VSCREGACGSWPTRRAGSGSRPEEPDALLFEYSSSLTIGSLGEDVGDFRSREETA
jgi:hypothetical protein